MADSIQLKEAILKTEGIAFLVHFCPFSAIAAVTSVIGLKVLPESSGLTAGEILNKIANHISS